MFGWFRKRDLGPQGLIVTTMPMPREAVESSDPYEPIASLIDFVNHILGPGGFLPDEVVAEMFWPYQVDYYFAQVRNGGHEQYLGNSGILAPHMARTIEACRSGLEAIGAKELAAIYRDLLALIADKPEIARRGAENSGFGEETPEFEALDRRFFALDIDAEMAKNRVWLLSRPWVRLVPRSDWQANVARIAQTNPLAAARRQAAERERRELQERDPAFILAKELCRKAGRRLVGINAFSPCKLDGDDQVGCFIATNKGVGIVFLLKGEAVLIKYPEFDGPDLKTATPEQISDWMWSAGSREPNCYSLRDGVLARVPIA